MSTPNPIALITGANRGIGFELARTLARDHSFHVLLGSRTLASGEPALTHLQSEGLSVEPLTLDLGSDSSIIAAAKEVEQKHGRLDLLVNNAGVYLDPAWSRDIRDLRKLYSETFDTNLFGTATVTEAFVPLLATSAVPRIVFLSSTLGSIGDRVNPQSIYDHVDSVSYRCSKAALDMLCANYARKFGDQGWKINAACPGAVKTGISNWVGDFTTEEAMPNLVRLCTLGKDGETGTFSDRDGIVAW